MKNKLIYIILLILIISLIIFSLNEIVYKEIFQCNKNTNKCITTQYNLRGETFPIEIMSYENLENIAIETSYKYSAPIMITCFVIAANGKQGTRLITSKIFYNEDNAIKVVDKINHQIKTKENNIIYVFYGLKNTFKYLNP